MRRTWLAVAALALFAASGCGVDPAELEPGMKSYLRDLAMAVVKKDEAAINAAVLTGAGSWANPVGAADENTPEGREALQVANSRWIRRCFKDAGIVEEKDVETFMQAIKFGITSTSAWVRFEIAANNKRAAEVVSFDLSRKDNRWFMVRYGRELAGMR